MSNLALRAQTVYPIASRCGVFSKTDVQNLLAKNVSKEDVAASVFHAVAVQTITTLSRGCDISLPVLFCGGPLTFIPALRKAFVDYLQLSDGDWVVPGQSHLIPAWGAALSAKGRQVVYGKRTFGGVERKSGAKGQHTYPQARPLFPNEDSYAAGVMRNHFLLCVMPMETRHTRSLPRYRFGLYDHQNYTAQL